jgi:hypothetical protein
MEALVDLEISNSGRTKEMVELPSANDEVAWLGNSGKSAASRLPQSLAESKM